MTGATPMNAHESQELQRRIRELTEQNAFLKGIIDRAMTKFCEDWSDGAIAAENKSCIQTALRLKSRQ